MAYDGKRKTLPSSRWANVIDVLSEWHVSYAEYCEAPAELVDEWLIRIQARNVIEARQAKRAETRSKRR